MAEIRPADVVYHIVNTIDNSNGNYYVDDLDYEWAVRAINDTLWVTVSKDGEASQTFSLVPVKE